MSPGVCGVSPTIGRDAGVRHTCYKLAGNQPALLRRGLVFTIDPSLRMVEGALSVIDIPYEPLRLGPQGKLFKVDAIERSSSILRCRVDLDRPGERFVHDQGDPETHCRNAYFTAMATYETFRAALGRPVAWSFWAEDDFPPLRLSPFAFKDLNAYYDRATQEIGFGFAAGPADLERADARLLRFTALSSDVVAHEVTHAVLDGLRPGYDFPVNPDVFAFHEAFADVVALLSRFSRPAYLRHLVRDASIDFLSREGLVSLAPQLGALIRKSGLRTLDVEWMTPDRADPDALRESRYDTASEAPHERGGLISSAVFEAFMRCVKRRADGLIAAVGRGNARADDYVVDQIAAIAATTARHFLAMCIRAIDYCPPAAIVFPDYLRALITADRVLVPIDRFGYREEIIDAFRRRGIYPDDIEVVSERALAWQPPDIATRSIPGLALGELRFSVTPVLPLNANEIRRQAHALALAIEEDPELYRALGLRRPSKDSAARMLQPFVASIRPTLRVGPTGFIDISIIAEVVQEREIVIGGGDDVVRHRGGATVILNASGEVSMIVSQRLDNETRMRAESEYIRSAVQKGWLIFDPDEMQFTVNTAHKRQLCSGIFQ